MKMNRINKIILFLGIFYFTAITAQEENVISLVIPEVTVNGICSDQDGIWVATYGKGIFFIPESGKIEQYSTDKGNIQDNLFYCIASNHKFVWAGSADGLYIFNKQTKRWIKRKFGKGGEYGNWIRSLAYDKYMDVLWIGRFMYLTKFETSTNKYTDYDLTVKGNEKTNTIKSIKIDGDSLVWFGTEAGLHKYKKKYRFEENGAVFFYDNRRNYFNGEGKNVSIASLLFEQSNIWIGLDEFRVAGNEKYNIGGIYKFDRKNEWTRFDIKDGLPGNGIYAMEKTGNYLWVSLYHFDINSKEQFGRGLALIERNTMKITPIIEAELPSNIFSMFFDTANMWFGTDKGLFRMNLINKFAKWN